MGTPHGGKLSDFSVDEIRDRLADRPADGKSVIRLVAVLECKTARSPGEIEEQCGWPEGAVYHWLNSLEDQGIDADLARLAVPAADPREDPLGHPRNPSRSP